MNYDMEVKALKKVHVAAVQALMKFLENKKVLARFLPTDEQMSRLQLTRLVEDSDDKVYDVGVAFGSFVMQNCRQVLPQDLFEDEGQALETVKRHNELEQWTMLKLHQKKLEEQESLVSKVDQALQQLHKQEKPLQPHSGGLDESQILALIDARSKEIHASFVEGGVNRMSGINDKLDLLEHKHKGQTLTDIAIIQQEITKMKIR